MAEDFYRSAGFETIERIDVPLQPGVILPSLRMIRAQTPSAA